MAVDMFMKLAGINGESQDSVHSGEIDVIGWNWGMSNTGTAHLGGGAGTGKANFQDLTFTKFVDKASTSLMQACATGKHIATATLTCRKAGGTPLEYLVITMTEAMVSNIQHGGSSSDERTTEMISLNFASLKVDYKTQSAQGSAAGDTPFNWSILKNAAA
jgi:type VI secretion system secreted protein Hcp